MIYLDNAAGSYPKPEAVARAMCRAIDEYGANPGRGGYQLVRRTEEMCNSVRQQLAELINAPDASRVVFTPGATASLNMAVWGLMQGGGHAICTSMEHNALFRPLAVLADAGRIELSVVDADEFGYITAADIAAAIRPSTRLIALSHASNVCGSVQPVEEIGLIARQHGIPLLVDVAQSAGLLPVDVQKMNASLVALAGHKALYGPAGIGALYVEEGLYLAPLFSGGGAESELRHQPAGYPQHLEAGSPNTLGIAAWGAALDFVSEIGISALYSKSMALTNQLEQALRPLPGLRLLKKEGESRPRVPLLSVVHERMTATELAECLDRFDVCARSGYQCAPLAHRTLGSFEEGSLRFSPGWFTAEEEISLTAQLLSQIISIGLCPYGK